MAMLQSSILILETAFLTESIQTAQDHIRAGNWTTAAQLCQQVLESVPEHLEAIELAAIAACQLGNFESAIVYYEKFLQLNPNSADAHYNLGTALTKLLEWERAIVHYQEAIQLDPNFVSSYYNLGNAYQELNRTEDAIATYQKVVGLNPEHRRAWNNLGLCLKQKDELEAALGAFHQALVIDQEYALTHNNLGDTLRQLGQFDDAIASLKRAIELDPALSQAHHNLAIALYETQQYQPSIDAFQTALALRPDSAAIHYNYSFPLLTLGNLEQGFQEYEYRWQEHLDLPKYEQPQWDGLVDLQGKTILLYPEQGMGDIMQFIRFAPILAERGARVLFHCPKPLFRLFQTVAGIDQLILQDYYLPLLNAPSRLKTVLETIPRYASYLSAPNEVKSICLTSKKLKVGIVWAGNPEHNHDRYRSAKLNDFLPLLQIPNVEFYSLQKGKDQELRQFMSENSAMIGTLHNLEPQLNDFADTASAIAALDLVITVDTSVAHLAGALGKPVWVLLCAIPDWRWLLNRLESPWYPSVRLFRQIHLSDWSTVMDEITEALPQLIQPQSELPVKMKSKAVEGMGLCLSIGGTYGWGIFGLNLVLQFLQTPSVHPIALLPSENDPDLNPIVKKLLDEKLQKAPQIQNLLDQHPHQILNVDLTVFKAFGNNFSTSPESQRIVGKRNIGLIFSEDTEFTPQEIGIGKQCDRIIAGSTWNTNVLRSYGLTQVETVQQGIDPTIFHPAPSSGFLRDRFVIFSGGKLEYRKGQDLVIAAFRIFQQRHPEALLMTAWHNHWIQTMKGIDQAGHVRGIPRVSDMGMLKITDWLIDNGVPTNAILDVGLVSNSTLAQMIREADVAVFSNRAEGGTNLVAMECFACGIPTILSKNTGHLDLISRDRCYPLSTQGKVASHSLYRGTEGWGESDVDEIVANLEAVYCDRQTAQQRGTHAAQWIQNWTWENQIQRLLKVLS
jgi:tetratricopeptide (TPR) repeat protein/glycosyltransferase involved in cell wall biosynthesis